jgi:hypothetical protein
MFTLWLSWFSPLESRASSFPIPPELPIPQLPILCNPTIPVYHMTIPPSSSYSRMYRELHLGMRPVSIVGQRSTEPDSNRVQAAHSKFCSDSDSDCTRQWQFCKDESYFCQFFILRFLWASYCPILNKWQQYIRYNFCLGLLWSESAEM